MAKRNLLASVVAILALIVPLTVATGCKDCLKANVDRIRLGCFEKCSLAFNAASSEYSSCYSECNNLVFNDHCCTGSCSANAGTCLRPFFANPMPTLEKRGDPDAIDELARIQADPKRLNMRALIARDWPYHLIRTTADLRALHPRLFRDTRVYFPSSSETCARNIWDTPEPKDIEIRADPGQVCCKAAQAIIGAGVVSLGKIIPPLGDGTGLSDEDKQASLILIMFGTASSFACSRLYKINCIFDGRLPTPTRTGKRSAC
ncbi:MAG: hypothetical protein M1814_001228 [Vezdaea aestivalis]|nr:MAG: hypothetical protein M1814_001228 [Vezdaea aestivalis]